MNRCSKTGLTDKNFKTILDVLNVYDPNDIAHVVPEMASPEFVQDVHAAFRAVLKHVNTLRYGPDHVQKMDQSDYSTIEGCIKQSTKMHWMIWMRKIMLKRTHNDTKKTGSKSYKLLHMINTYTDCHEHHQ